MPGSSVTSQIPSVEKFARVAKEFGTIINPRLLDRRKAICAYAGLDADERGNPVHERGGPPRRTMNYTKRGADVLRAHLTANNPSHEFIAKRLSKRGRAFALSRAMDNLNGEINRLQVSRMGLLNALLSERTVYRSGVRSGGESVKMHGRIYDLGQPYLKLIDNDDHLFDYTARCPDEMRWEGNRYRVCKDVAEASGAFNPRQLDRVSTVGDLDGTSNLSGGANTYQIGGRHPNEAFLYDMIELMDIFVYQDGETWLLTCSGNPEDTSDWLRIEKWTGPERGPYVWEEYFPVPNNIMGVSWQKVQAVQEIIASQIMQKIVQSAMNAKAGLLVSGDASDPEIEAVRTSADGFVTKVADASNYHEKTTGGVVKELWQLLSQLTDMWNTTSGNVDVLGGTSDKPGTATEFQGLAANAAVTMADLKRTKHETEERISRNLAFYLQNDPARQFMAPHRLPNGQWLEVQYDPQAEEDDHTDYEYRIRQNSMSAVDPGVLLRRLMEFYGVFLPTGALNIVEAARAWTDLAGIENADAIVPDQMRAMENEMAMAGVPEPIPGQITGPSNVNPAAFGPQAAQGGMPGMGAMGPVGGMGGMGQAMQRGMLGGGGQQMTPLAAGMSARSNRVPA